MCMGDYPESSSLRVRTVFEGHLVQPSHFIVEETEAQVN